ncbi:MAG: AmmeMemoRadiSam system protein B [Nitrospinae bacterium]|nr:AmmeMemoRadiSam system protein B [Nitrospinota bacterium]
MTIREPAVAGFFYPASKRDIESQIASFDTGGAAPVAAYGAVVPHAGYRYSGLVAAKVYSRIKPRGSIILMGPNHGAGRNYEPPPPVAIMAEGEWVLPGGKLPIDAELAQALLDETDLLTDAPWAHELEHSLEVQLPFIMHYSGKVSFAPIIISHLSAEEVVSVSEGIYRGLEKYGKPVTLVASTDFSHYIPHEKAREQDHKAIERILAMDGFGLLKVVAEERISMCGCQPTAVVIEVCKKLGAKKAELVDYRTSGDSSGDYSSVVGYGGLIIT